MNRRKEDRRRPLKFLAAKKAQKPQKVLIRIGSFLRFLCFLAAIPKRPRRLKLTHGAAWI